jgi:hypothetical protein
LAEEVLKGGVGKEVKRRIRVILKRGGREVGHRSGLSAFGGYFCGRWRKWRKRKNRRRRRR